MLFSLAARRRTGREIQKLLFVDVRRAYLQAPVTRRTFIELPDEAGDSTDTGELNKSMYGTRDAAQNWENTYAHTLTGMGFKRGQATPCAFFHPHRGVKVVVHGDDITALAGDSQLDWFQSEISKAFDVKNRGRLGDGQTDVQDIRILNRVVRWTNNGLEYEADQRHAEIIIEAMGLEGAKGPPTPGIKKSDYTE